MNDIESFALFGAFAMTFILLSIMFTIKMGPVIGISLGFAAAVAMGVMGYAIWSEIG